MNPIAAIAVTAAAVGLLTCIVYAALTLAFETEIARADARPAGDDDFYPDIDDEITAPIEEHA